MTDWATLMATVQVPVPEQPPPLQPAKDELESGAALKTTWAPEVKFAEQVAPQLSPEGALVTVPPPAPDLETESVYCG